MEMQGKMEFLNMVQIRRMNAELRNILEAMPEGIVLVDEESMDVTMGNKEFLKIFKGTYCLNDENSTTNQN
jgi:PAS domain-containing protein